MAMCKFCDNERLKGRRYCKDCHNAIRRGLFVDGKRIRKSQKKWYCLKCKEIERFKNTPFCPNCLLMVLTQSINYGKAEIQLAKIVINMMKEVYGEKVKGRHF